LKSEGEALFRSKDFVGAARKYAQAAMEAASKALSTSAENYVKAGPSDADVKACQNESVQLIRACHSNAAAMLVKVASAPTQESGLSASDLESCSFWPSMGTKGSNGNTIACELALWHADRTVSWAPGWFKSHLRKAQSLQCLGRFQDALESAKKAVELNPSDAAS